MPVSEDYLDHVRDLLGAVGKVDARRMFGGAGLYADGVMFALVDLDVLYLKADDVTKPMFEAEGLAPFTFSSQGRTMTTSYWRAPDRIFDEPEELRAWARRALSAARRAAARSPKKDKAGSASKSKGRKAAPPPIAKPAAAPKSKSPATSARQRSGKSPGGKSRKR